MQFQMNDSRGTKMYRKRNFQAFSAPCSSVKRLDIVGLQFAIMDVVSGSCKVISFVRAVYLHTENVLWVPLKDVLRIFLIEYQ